MPLSATRVRILEATLAGVSYEGFSTTTKDISLLAEVRPGTLFQHYASKEKLLQDTYAYAANLLFRPGVNLPGHTLYEQRPALWFRTAHQALTHRDASTYWALYRATPGYARISFPAEMHLEAFEVVVLMLHRCTGTPAEHGCQRNSLLAWQWVAQWIAALQLALPLYLLGDTVGWPTDSLFTIAQVLNHAFEAAWLSLELPRQTLAEPSVYG